MDAVITGEVKRTKNFWRRVKGKDIYRFFWSASGAGLIARTGQLRPQAKQRRQSVETCRRAVFRNPSTSRVKSFAGQAATQRPQALHRWQSTCGVAADNTAESVTDRVPAVSRCSVSPSVPRSSEDRRRSPPQQAVCRCDDRKDRACLPRCAALSCIYPIFLTQPNRSSSLPVWMPVRVS